MPNWRLALRKNCQFAVIAGVLLLEAGCNNPPSDQQVQQKAAETTQQVKQGAQQAATQARSAAATAEDKINAVAAGVKQGLNNGAPSTAIDLNGASPAQLETLPGITPAKAHRIVAGRPYSAPNDLVTKNVLTQDQFDQISGKVQAK
jgi:DNA uptake protein ComE-like DNA-binding protein